MPILAKSAQNFLKHEKSLTDEQISSMDGGISSMDESAFCICHSWMEETHPWMKVSSVDVIHGWRNLIHGLHPMMKITNDGHG